MNILDLPNELLEYITSFLEVNAIVCLSKTCRRLHEISSIESLWQALCQKDYNVNSSSGWNITYRDIYTKVLKKCDFLGWKRLALLPYGGLVHVCWAEGEIQVNAYKPSHREDAKQPFKRKQLFSIRWNRELNVVEVYCMQHRSGPKLSSLTQSSRNQYKSNSKFPRGFLDHPDAFHGCNLITGSNLPLLPLSFPSRDEQAPIKLGLYTASYGPHGVEILNFMFKENDPFVIEGLKISGDPNVPAGNVSVTIFLKKPMVLTLDDQQSLDSLLEADSRLTDASFQALFNANSLNTDQRQPFSLPFQVFDQFEALPNFCLARFAAEGRIAGHMFTTPSYCRCHFVKFSDTVFAVLWLELYSFSMFYKAELPKL
ncbi:F-box only protein 31-like isoform X2 [Physella acuta]|uniref:F-box only protein 31-like isoform X2 n=1 Tax=Physella acuta TaxID=109671 RepID=UPI0027DD42F6|nr:F-box only protein 31-like isoform X2 [Physella acuta]